MHSLFQFVIRCVVIISLANPALAQDKREADALRATVTASASTERVRFTAPASVAQMRLEVYDAAGRKLFDNELRGGNVLDWLLQDGQAARLTDGAYLCVVTVKGRSGRFTQRLGSVLVEQGSASLQAFTATQLTAQQAAVVGPVEEDTTLRVIKSDESQTGTVIAHNGEEGQIVRGRGALSFRLGDFFSGKDQEQMRLTTEGKLGLGVAEPQAKLDVAGPIRTSEGIVFPDGSVQTTAYVASGRSLSERSGLKRDAQGRALIEQDDKAAGPDKGLRLAPSISGAGTTGRMTKWLDGPGGVVGDTAVSEANGAMVVGNAGATGNIQIFGPANADVFAGMGPDVVNGPAFNYGYAGSSFGRSAGFFNVRPDASAVAPNPSLRFLTANVQRMIITNTGNVGIGTTTPSRLLDVNGGGRFAPGGSGGDVVIGTPNTETGMTISNASGRADLRFNGSTLKLVAGPAGGPPSDFNGLAITTAGNVGIGLTNPSFKLQVDGGLSVGVAGYSANSTGVSGSSTNSVGVDGYSVNGTGVYGHSSFGVGVFGTSSSGIGVDGRSDSDVGVSGRSDTSYGARGTSNSSYGVYGASGSNIGVYGYSNSNYGVYGYSVSSYAGYFGGDVYAIGTITQSSDARLKQDVLNLGYGLPEVLRLRPVSWHWKDRPERGPQLGLIAQEVEALLPELVTTAKTAEQTKGVNYIGLLPVIIKAIQQQQLTITTLKDENTALQQQKAALETRLTALEQLVQQLKGPRAQAQPQPQQEQP